MSRSAGRLCAGPGNQESTLAPRSPEPFEPADGEMVEVLARMGEVLMSASTVETALLLVAQVAAETIPSSLGLGLMVGTSSTMATGPIVGQADQLQHQFQAGPSLTACRDRTVVRADDIATDTRWPQWSPAVTDKFGLSSVLSAPVIADDEPVGAITVYSQAVAAFDDRSALLLGLFGDQAAILVPLEGTPSVE